jgi:hypothetical protein
MAELSQINAAIADLDPSEKLALISMFEVKPENFDHHIEIQANIKTRQNVLLYPEYTGTLKKSLRRGGARGQKRKTPGTDRRCGTQKPTGAIADTNEALSKTTYERTQRLWDQNIGCRNAVASSQSGL